MSDTSNPPQSDTTSDSELDQVLHEVYNRGFKCAAAGYISKDEENHAVKEAKAALQQWAAQEANKARIDEQEIVAQNLPHCGGDMCMSCHFVDDFQAKRIAQLTDKET